MKNIIKFVCDDKSTFIPKRNIKSVCIKDNKVYIYLNKYTKSEYYIVPDTSQSLFSIYNEILNLFSNDEVIINPTKNEFYVVSCIQLFIRNLNNVRLIFYRDIYYYYGELHVKFPEVEIQFNENNECDKFIESLTDKISKID